MASRAPKRCRSFGCRQRGVSHDLDFNWCQVHVKPEKRNLTTSAKLSLYNEKGLRLCDRIGCWKTKNSHCYGGVFCLQHYRELASIRRFIDHSGSLQEIQARQREVEIRKTCDAGHMKFLLGLEEKLSR
jgi:hypothetical protein